jgi:hypothetical protein
MMSRMEMRMQRRKPVGLRPHWRPPESLQIHAAMAAAAALPLLLLTSVVPRPLVLPVLCLVAIAGACIVSFLAWKRSTVDHPQRVTMWDVAGAFAFIGCAAAMMSNPEHLIYFADSATTVRLRE